MSTTDNRIVRMVFDNALFKRAAAETKSALDSVNAAITKAGQSKGLLNLNKNMQEVAINASKMQVATAAAIGTIASKATAAGVNLAKSLAFDPIRGGFKEYEALLNKQNTIMNSTGMSADEVKTVLNSLNKYSDQTIFKFSDMTDAITKFTNAGVPLKKAETSIRGIANAAAFAGLGSEEAGRAFYAFSQSMSTGFLMLQDFNQLDNAGFSTIRFKQEVIDAAVAVGTLTKTTKGYKTETGKIVTVKNFRNMLQEQFATTEVLNKALNKYADTTTKLGAKAFQSATEVRTFTAFMGTLRESIESGWAQVFTEVFGGLEESTAMWTKLSGAIGGVIQGFFSFLTTTFRVFREMGGITKVGNSLKNVLAPIGAIFGAIGEAWRNAFGRGSGGQGLGSTLYGIITVIELLTKPFAFLAFLIEQLVHPLTILFLIIKAGGIIVGRAIGFIKDFVKSIFDLASFKMDAGASSGTIIGWFKAVIKEVERAIQVFTALLDEGASIKDAFKALGDIDLKFPKFPAMPELPDWMKGLLPDTIKLPGVGGIKVPKIGSIFGGGGEGEEKNKIETVSTSVMDLASNVLDLNKSAEKLTGNDLMNARLAIFDPEQGTEPALLAETMERLAAFDLANGIGNPTGIANIRELEGNFSTLDTVMKGISENTILSSGFAGIANIRELEGATELVSTAMADAKESGEGFGGVIRNIISGVGKFLGLIEGEDIVHSLNFALLGTMGITAFKLFRNFSDVLGGVSKVINGFSKVGPAVTETINSAGDALKSFQTRARAELIKAIAIAVLILAGALLILSFIPRDKMITALIGLAGAMAILSAVMIVLDKTMSKITTGKLVALGFAFAAIGVGMLAIATALLIFNKVDNESVYRAAIVLGILFIGLEKIGKLAEKSGRKLVAAGLAIAIIGVSLGILAGALLLFKLVDNESLLKGAGVITVLTLALLALGMVPAARLAKAGTAMLAISVAMLLLANALIIFGTVQWESIGKAGVVLAGLTLALILMSGMGASGAAVIVAVGAAMLGIAMACLIFNKVNWTALAMAGVALLGLIVAFAAFMAIVSFFAPAIIVLSVFAGSIAALALALALLGAVFLVLIPLSAVAATAFAAFAAAAAVAIAVFLQTLATEMPTIKAAMSKIIQGIVDVIVDGIPRIIDGILKILDAIIARADDFAEAAVQLVVALIEGIIRSLNDVIAAAVRLVIAFLDGLASQAGKITEAAVNLLLKLVQGLIDNTFLLVNGAIDMFVDFLHQFADAIRSSGGPIGEGLADVLLAMSTLGFNIIQGLIKGIQDAAPGLDDVVKAVVGNIPIVGGAIVKVLSPSRVMMVLGKFIVLGLAKGIQDTASAAIVATASMMTGVIATSMEYVSSFVQKLDQMGIAARAKAEGLARAAEKAAKAAEKTKSEKDDRAAKKLGEQAERESERADKLEERAQKAKDRANRDQEFAAADTLTKAKMKSEDAQSAIDDAKAAEARAGAAIYEARALEAQAKSGKYSAAETKRMRAEAEALRKEAAKEAALANTYLQNAKTNAAEALALQKQAGAEAALAFQQQFDAEARADAEQDAFDAMNDTEKAVKRRADAAALQAAAATNLAKAKELAYTDVEAANELAQLALDQADQARDYIRDAIGYEKAVADAAKSSEEKAAENAKTNEVKPTIDLTASDQAAIAFANLAELYDSATASAAAGTTVEFNQYNNSPEALSPTEVYRQTNNLLTHAYERLGQAA